MNGDTQHFWEILGEPLPTSTDSTQAVRDLLDDSMEADVDTRLNRQKRDRLVRDLTAGFDGWFVANHDLVDALTVWERLAGLGVKLSSYTTPGVSKYHNGTEAGRPDK